MDDYRPIMINGAHLVALYALAYISAPLTPHNWLEYGVLAAASLWLLYAMVLMTRARRRPSSLFYGAIAVIPWAFYLELWYIKTHNEGIEREVFEANLAHAVAIYQSFKYLILACAVGATFKGLYQAVKNFARSGPYS
ncbi:MAG TPA: hypothetical protein H9898_04445 [Candidatus Anaerobiospirillum stercoravium]|nr:hypothetical protein [Candidatus Anaerobiospirillum stercoravium]